jgi:hypothetical protein
MTNSVLSRSYEESMRKQALITLAAVAALALVGPVAASGATTHTVALSYTLTPSASSTVKGTFSGTPFGKGSVVVKTGKTRGVYTVTLTGSGGTATFTLAGGPTGGGKIAAVWKFTKGTGKYTGITGRGKASGSTSGHFNLTGSVKY